MCCHWFQVKYARDPDNSTKGMAPFLVHWILGIPLLNVLPLVSCRNACFVYLLIFVCLFFFFNLSNIHFHVKLILLSQPVRPGDRICVCILRWDPTSNLQPLHTDFSWFRATIGVECWMEIWCMMPLHEMRGLMGFCPWIRTLERQRKPSSIWSWLRPRDILRTCALTSKLFLSVDFVVVLDVLLRPRHATPMDRGAGQWSQRHSCWVCWRMQRAMQRLVRKTCDRVL